MILPLTMTQEYAPIVASSVKSTASYRRNIRQAVRGLWSGVITFEQAFESMLATIRTGLTQAWESGAKEAGIKPSELTEQEIAALNERIFEENNRLSPFLESIEAANRENDGSLTTHYNRAELWVNRWLDIQNEAKTMASSDPKLEWVLGRTEQHCRSCLRLNGKVKRASYWQQVEIRPQSPPNSALSCEGWRCDCRLLVTDRAISKGPLPR